MTKLLPCPECAKKDALIRLFRDRQANVKTREREALPQPPEEGV